MIFIANDSGSKEFLPEISKRAPASLLDLPFGDFVFAGCGPANTSISVAIERKTWTDLTDSLESERLQGHQAPGLLSFDRRFLLIEGIVRRGINGGLEVRRGPGWFPVSRSKNGWTWKRVHSALASLDEFADLRPIYTQNRQETVEAVVAKYAWWQKPYEEHRTVNRIKNSMSPPPRHAIQFNDMYKEPTWFQMAMKEFPTLGWDRSQAIDKAFGSMKEAVEADVKRWREIPGVGKVMAERIVRTLREGGTGKK